MLNTLTGSPRSSPPAEEWYRCWICWYQRALAFSASLIPGVSAEATISLIVRKLVRPLESQGSTTSVRPTFSIRTARFDCQACSMAPSRFIPQPIGDRQFVPSIVPPCTTVYLCAAVPMFSTWLLVTSPGWAFEAQGSSAGSAPGAVKRTAGKIAVNMLVSPRDEGWRQAVIVIPARYDSVDRDETSQPLAPGGARPWVRFGRRVGTGPPGVGHSGDANRCRCWRSGVRAEPAPTWLFKRRVQ